VRLLMLAVLCVTALAPASANAQPLPLRGQLAGLAFLLGDWSNGRGVVAETGGTSTGRSSFTAEVDGTVLLRRDHTDLFDKAGKAAGGFDQMMWIYAEGGTLHADYADDRHVIHYTSAAVTPDRSVTFTSAAQPGAPQFQLSYVLQSPTTLDVTFAIKPPAAPAWQIIAKGELTHSR